MSIIRDVHRMTFAKTLAVSLFVSPYVNAQQSASPESSSHLVPLSVEQVVTKLEQKNAQRAAALEGFEGKRIYRMQYRGFPGDKDAEMVVKVSFHAPNSKEFTVISKTGSKFVLEHVFNKLLEGEQEAAKGENHQDTALTRQNYQFELVAYESTPQGGQYVLNLLPRTKNKFLYRGKIWIDAKDFAVVRIEAEPGKNPSFWIKKTGIAHRYIKVNNFWLPAENHTESFTRLGGKAMLSIEYEDYKIIKANPIDTATSTPQSGQTFSLDNAAVGTPAIFANEIHRAGTR
jgi:hypothetical protein